MKHLVDIPSINKIREAQKITSEFLHRTPLLVSSSLNDLTGASLHFKCENFQRTGSYKLRGASYAVSQLTDDQKKKGVCTHSSGNFAQALSLSALLQGIKAYIVMPNIAPEIKKNGVRAFHGEIIESGPTLDDRETMLNAVEKRTSASFIHPSNNMNVIIGHSSATLEILEDEPDIDTIITPVGGGGLIAGTALGAYYKNQDIEIIGAEPSGADDAYHSLKAGKIIPVKNPNTIADGLRTSLGTVNFPIIQRFVKEIILVDDNEIIHAMRLIWERLKIVIEPSSAITLAAVIKRKDQFKHKKVALILTGGNVDLSNLPF